MRDDPGGADLLRAAREALADSILPTLLGGQRYTALMIANAIGIVERELASGERLCAADDALAAMAGRGHGATEDAMRALCRAIRGGRHDGDERLHALLYARAIAAVAISRPDALTAEERQRDQPKPEIREVLNGAGQGSGQRAHALRLC